MRCCSAIRARDTVSGWRRLSGDRKLLFRCCRRRTDFLKGWRTLSIRRESRRWFSRGLRRLMIWCAHRRAFVRRCWSCWLAYRIPETCTILRTAAAFGATGAAISASGQSGTASPFSPKALRASAGAALHLAVLSGTPLPILMTQLKVAGFRMLASSVHEPETGEHPMLAPWEVDWCGGSALLVGNEGSGLPVEVERSADARIRIPMASGVESLNAAAAAAVLFYEAARQRNSVRGRNIQEP